MRRPVIRGSERRLRLASSLAASGAIHGMLLCWLVGASAIASEPRPQTNVSSYSGSWIVCFAERQPEPGDPPRVMSPPAAIRKTGTADSVELLHHLDDRLDQSAKEALSKWEFEPALRDGRPVDVDAIFEIPFRLAAKPKK